MHRHESDLPSQGLVSLSCQTCRELLPAALSNGFMQTTDSRMHTCDRMTVAPIHTLTDKESVRLAPATLS